SSDLQERYERLVGLVEEISWEENKRFVGRDVEILVSVGEGRKDAATHRKSGRARDGRLVHFLDTDDLARPGDLVTSQVTYAAPHHLVADAGVPTVERTRAGDLHEAAAAADTAGVMLGLPSVRAT